MKTIQRVALAMICTLAAVAGDAHFAEKKTLTVEGARKIIAAVAAMAHQNNAGGAVAVVDEGGNLVALERLDGTFSAAANISIGKARTAAMFKKPTRFFEEVIGKGRTAMVALDEFTPLQGGVPVVVGGQVIGAVGVSGANSAQQDEEFAMAGAAALSAAPSPVTYFDSAKVNGAFAKGAVLFDAGEKYMVHASRRDKPGMAEVHTQDADIVYVLEGTATVVTGGTAVDPRTIAPDEIRGAAIAGGEERRLAKGDVLIVPAGTPHWFKEVSNPFLYYVVKAR